MAFSLEIYLCKFLLQASHLIIQVMPANIYQMISFTTWTENNSCQLLEDTRVCFYDKVWLSAEKFFNRHESLKDRRTPDVRGGVNTSFFFSDPIWPTKKNKYQDLSSSR